MNPDVVAARVAEIEAAGLGLRGKRYDAEAAHSLEDDLYEDILDAIAKSVCAEPAECCRLAVATKKFNFPRWCS